MRPEKSVTSRVPCFDSSIICAKLPPLRVSGEGATIMRTKIWSVTAAFFTWNGLLYCQIRMLTVPYDAGYWGEV